LLYIAMMPRALLRLLPVFFLLLPSGAWAVLPLCAVNADPCIVANTINVTSGSIFDLGGRDLIIATGKTINVTGAGAVAIFADDVTFQDSAKIIANGSSEDGGEVNIFATGAVTMAASSRIDVNSAYAGSIDITAESVALSGELRAISTTRDGDGGLITIVTTGDSSVGGAGINATGGDRFGSGGLVDVIADGDIGVTAKIFVKGGDGDGGDVDLDAGGSITTSAAAELNSIATFEFGSGGAISLTALQDVVVNGPIRANGSGSLLEGGGDGGDLDVIADFGDAIMNGRIELTGAGPDGSGGFLDVFADGALELKKDAIVSGAQEGTGGDVILDGTSILVTGFVDLRAGIIGGSFDSSTTGTTTFASTAVVNASGTGGFLGGGTFDVLACNLVIQAGASLLALEPGQPPRAIIKLRASGTMTIGGTVQAGSGVKLEWRDVPPSLLGGSVVIPAPTITQNVSLPCCGNCSTTTTLPTTTTTLATTTTSVPVTTSSTTPTSSTVTTVSSTSSTTPTSSTVTTVSSTSSTTPTSTTVTTVPSTSSTSTTIDGSTTSTVTSTTTSTVTSTTTSTLPLSCLDEPLLGFDAVACAVGLLNDDLALRLDDDLGGRKKAKGLRKAIGKAGSLVEKARLNTKAKKQAKFLKKAGRKIASFERKVAKFAEKGKVSLELAATLNDMALVARSRVETLQVAVLTPAA
jgi:hypothetical protein